MDACITFRNGNCFRSLPRALSCSSCLVFCCSARCQSSSESRSRLPKRRAHSSTSCDARSLSTRELMNPPSPMKNLLTLEGSFSAVPMPILQADTTTQIALLCNIFQNLPYLLTFAVWNPCPRLRLWVAPVFFQATFLLLLFSFYFNCSATRRLLPALC